MIKEIKYNGYSANPSDYECADGDLALSMGLINEDGALKTISQPVELLVLDDNTDVLCIHKTSAYTHYVVKNVNNGTVEWFSDSTPRVVLTNSLDVLQALPIGNTLILLTSAGDRNYYLWKENAYLDLGNAIPELDMSARLDTSLIDTSEFIRMYGLNTNDIDTVVSGINADLLLSLSSGATSSIALYGDMRTSVYNKLFSIVNRMQKKLREEGYFLYPFYVRFAFRLYDGTYSKHTVPILLAPSTWGKPFTSVRITENVGFYDVHFFASKLTASINSSRSLLANWSDIIEAVDVFVTPPIVNYTDNLEALKSLSVYPFKKLENGMYVTTEGAPKIMNSYFWKSYDDYFGEIEETYTITRRKTLPDGNVLFNFSELKSYTDVYMAVDISTGYVQITSSSGIVMPYQEASAFKESHPEAAELLPTGGVYVIYNVSSDLRYAGSCIISNGNKPYLLICGPKSTVNDCSPFEIALERIDTSAFEDKLREYNQFYKVAEISYTDIMNWKGYLSLPLKKRVLSCLETQQALIDTGQGHVLYKSSFLQSYNNRLNVVVEKENYMPVNIHSQNACIEFDYEKIQNAAFVEIYSNSQKAYVRVNQAASVRNDYRRPYFFAYPHSSATKLIIFISVSKSSGGIEYCKYEIALTKHPFLNLAYAFNDFETLPFTVTIYSSIDEHTAAISSLENRTEIVCNNKVAVSQVNNPFLFPEENIIDLSMVSNVYALSSAAQPLSEGQFGQYPLYAFTDEGIWAIEVSSDGTYSAKQPIARDVCSSPKSIMQLDNSVLFISERGIMHLVGRSCDCISNIIDTDAPFVISNLPVGVRVKDLSTYTIDNLAVKPFKEFVLQASMLYDYYHQHIIVYNPDISYAYRYSLKSKYWCMVPSNIKNAPLSYPSCFAVTKDNVLIDFAQYNNAVYVGLIITRPFKIDDPNTFKTINTIIQRGMCRSNHVQQVLYGSNDLIHWHTVWSSVDKIMRGFRGTPYKAYRLALVCKFDKDESIYGFTVAYEPRMTNQVR